MRHDGNPGFFRWRLAQFAYRNAGWERHEHDYCHESEWFQRGDDAKRFRLAKRSDCRILNESGNAACKWKRELYADSNCVVDRNYGYGHGDHHWNFRVDDAYHDNRANGERDRPA